MRLTASRDISCPLRFAALLLLLMALHDSGARAAEPTILLRARLVEPRTRSVEGASLLLRDGAVAGRGAFDGDDLRRQAPQAAVIDLDGSFLLPGLVDLRVHAGAQRSPGHVDELGPEGTARLLLATGVTSYVDVHLGEAGRRWRERQSQEPTLAARAYRGGPVLTAPGGFGADFPAAQEVRSLADVDSALASIGAPGDVAPGAVVTVVFDGRDPRRRLDEELLRELLEELRRRSMPGVVAVGTWSDVGAALRAGATWLCHLPEGEIPADTLEEVRRRPPRWIPTVAVGLDFVELLSDEELRDDPLLRRVAPDDLVDDYAQVRIPQTRYADLRRRREQTYANLSALDAAGVHWLAGSDAGSIGTFFGWSLHRELRHWQQAGLDRWTILAAATTGPAQALGGRSGFEEGDRADFLVTPRDPREDVAALAEVRHLILAGRWVELAAVATHVPRDVRREDPPNPMPFGSRAGLFVAVLIFFAVLLLVRGAIKRAARSS